MRIASSIFINKKVPAGKMKTFTIIDEFFSDVPPTKDHIMSEMEGRIFFDAAAFGENDLWPPYPVGGNIIS